MFRMFKLGNSKKDCCLITIEEVKDEKKQNEETASPLQNHKSCCS
ncbi:hypothetical protein [Bacillus sinesaloumensis]|nr:hypothetical protein [Bacillus sinesaloumensis]